MPEPGFYEDMAGISTELFEEYQQAYGEIFLVRIPSTPTPGRVQDVTLGAPEKTLLQAVALPIQKKYVDGTLLVGRETQVMFSPPGIEPSMDDTIEISGRDRKIIKIKRIPDAGVPVAYIVFVLD